MNVYTFDRRHLSRRNNNLYARIYYYLLEKRLKNTRLDQIVTYNKKQ